MSEKHLKKGSEFPQKTNDKLRLYSMKYCLYAQRARIVLVFKSIPHEVINVSTVNKPEWIFNLNPIGKVPILDTGTEIIPESVNICDYLDEIYPDPPLYSENKEERDNNAVLLKDCESVVSILIKAIKSTDESTYPMCVQQLIPFFEIFEDELSKQGLFFGGGNPRFVDFMLWPVFERIPVYEIMLNTKFPDARRFPRFYSWYAAMHEQRAVQMTNTDLEKQVKVYEAYRIGDPDINFDI